MWIAANNDQIWLPRGQMSDLEQCLNWLLTNFRPTGLLLSKYCRFNFGLELHFGGKLGKDLNYIIIHCTSNWNLLHVAWVQLNVNNYGPEGEPYSNLSVSVRSSVTDYFFLTGSSLCSLLLQNYSTDFSYADTNLPREQCRFATYTSFWPSGTPPWLQVKVTKYLNFVNLGCSALGMNANICWGHIKSPRVADLI